MARTVTLLLALLSLTTSAISETAPGQTAAVQTTLFAPGHTDSRLFGSLTGGGTIHSTALTCCKICSVGKACGNTCVSRDTTVSTPENPSLRAEVIRLRNTR
jgi:hypothetical protein